MLGALFEQDNEDNWENLPEIETASQNVTNFKNKSKMDKPAEPRDSLGFVGLENQGATCYLNSLIQVMYMSPELRQGLFSIDPMELGLGLIAEHEEEKANLEKKGAIEPDDNLMESLVAMGVEEATARYALIKTKNKGIEEAFECIMELGDKPPPLSESPKKKKKPRYVPLELQRLFSELQLINKATISTEDLTSKGFNWQSFDGRVQHDAHELNRLLVDALEKSLKKTSGETLCKSLYEGTVVNQILCTQCLRISEREESFYDMNMQVIDCANVVKALHNFCKPEVLTGDSAYACETCRGKTTALRSTKIKRLPSLLTFSCNRFKIDRTTNWQRVKVTALSEYPLALNMNPFVYGYQLNESLVDQDPELDNAVVSSAKKSMIWIERIKEEAELYLDSCLALSATLSPHHTATRLEDFQWSTRQIEEFRMRIAAVEELDPFQREKVEDNHRYALHAIIIHRGSAYSGHYFAYVRDNMHEAQYQPLDANAFTAAASNAGKGGKKGGKGKDDDAVSKAKDSTSSNQSNKNGGTHKVAVTEETQNGSIGDTKDTLDIKEEYIFDEESGSIFVRQDSLIHKLLYIFEQESENFLKTNKRRKMPSKKDKPFFLKAPTITRCISEIYKENWGKTYKAEHGTVDQFLHRHDAIFEDLGNGEFAVNNRQDASMISVIPEESFQALYLSKQPVYLPKLTSKATSASIKPDVSKTTVAIDDIGIDGLDEDEMLARALQDSLNAEEADSSASVLKKETKEIAWQTAGASRKKVEQKLATAEELAAAEAAAAKAEQEAAAAAAERVLIRRGLVEDLLRYTAGLFLEFNDSRVSQITYDTLQRAFQGVDSAYLLVYRRINTYSDLFPSQLFTSQATTKPASSITKSICRPPTPPAHWQQIIRQTNEQLVQQRSLYAEKMQQTVIAVYFASSLHYESPCFALHTGVAEKASSLTPCIYVEIDTRKTIADLLKVLLTHSLDEQTDESTMKVLSDANVHTALLSELALKYGANGKKEVDSWMSQLCISRLERVVGPHSKELKAFNSSFFATTPALNTNTIAAYTQCTPQQSGTPMLLLWAPTIEAEKGRDIAHGDACRPLPIKTWLLVPKTGVRAATQVNAIPSTQLSTSSQTLKGSSWGNKAPAPALSAGPTASSSQSLVAKPSTIPTGPPEIVVSNANQVALVAGHMTVFDAVLFLAEKHGFDAMRSVVRARIPDLTHADSSVNIGGGSGMKNSKQQAQHQKATNQQPSTERTKLVVVFDQGEVSLQTAVQALGLASGSVPDTSPMSALWFIRELYVEDVAAQGLHHESLSERFLHLQLHMLSLVIEFDSSVHKEVSLVAQQPQNLTGEKDGNGNTATNTSGGELPDSIDIEILKTSTVRALKEKILLAYDLSALAGLSLETCRLRLGNQRGEAVLEDEDQSLEVALGIGSASNGHNKRTSSNHSNLHLYLETGATQRPPETIWLNAMLVHGNATSMKYTAAEAGWRSGELLPFDPASESTDSTVDGQSRLSFSYEPVSLEVPLSMTVRALRDLIGVRLLHLPEHWTDIETVVAHRKNPADAAAPSPANSVWQDALQQHPYYAQHDYRGRRLRRTSWMGEFADLLLESDKKHAGNPSTTASSASAASLGFMTLRETELKDGDLLLLEEGQLPVKGMYDLMISFWHEEPLFDLPAKLQQSPQSGGHSSTETNAATEADTTATSEESPSSGVENDELSVQCLAAHQQRLKCLHRMEEVHVSIHGTLQDLHTRVAEVVARHIDDLLDRLLGPEISPLIDDDGFDFDATKQEAKAFARAALRQRLLAPENLLLREARPDLLPGKCLWMVDSNQSGNTGAAPAAAGQTAVSTTATSSTVTSTEQTSNSSNDKANGNSSNRKGRKKNQQNQGSTATNTATTSTTTTAPTSSTTTTSAAPVNKVFGSDSSLAHTPLKKLSLKPERGLIVTLLPLSQYECRGAPGSIRLWVQRLLNPRSAGQGQARMNPTWPPLSAVLSGGIAPTVGHLHRAIVNVLPDLQVEHLVVYKYHLALNQWEEIKHEAQVGKVKKAENIFHAPHNIKEGTLLCAFSKLDLLSLPPSSTSVPTAGRSGTKPDPHLTQLLQNVSTAVEISLPMDVYLQQRKAEAALLLQQQKQQIHAKHHYGGQGTGSSNNGKDAHAGGRARRPAETALMLHLDLDDWDD